MRWTGKLAVVAVAALMSLPTAYTLQEKPVVAGHTTYADMDGLDPCLAGIVGVIRLRVMWFNDQVLFERAAEDGASWVYATEHGAPDPRNRPLLATGRVYEFPDPNGVDWRIVEYNFTGVRVEEYPADPPQGGLVTWHAWVVETGPTMRDYAATGRAYNFVNLVDTCKFRAAGGPLHHGRDASGNWTSSHEEDTTEEHHFANDPSHFHQTYQVDLYVGKEPRTVLPPGGGDPQYLGETG